MNGVSRNLVVDTTIEVTGVPEELVDQVSRKVSNTILDALAGGSVVVREGQLVFVVDFQIWPGTSLAWLNRAETALLRRVTAAVTLMSPGATAAVTAFTIR